MNNSYSDAKMTPDHQWKALDSSCEDLKSEQEDIIEDCESGSATGSENDFPAFDFECEDWAEKYAISVRRFHNCGNYSKQIDVKESKCPNCDGFFTPHHQC